MMKSLFVKSLNRPSGNAAIEFGLIAIGLSFAIIAIMQGIVANVSGLLVALKSGTLPL
jgi:Flp pilus assembly pilin Flp